MDKKDIILATFAPANGVAHTPVQVQKLLFLIDRGIPELVGGPYYDFQPYNYGPFDVDVYNKLDILASEGYVEVIPEQTWSSYRLTEKGQQAGDKLLSELNEKAQKFIVDASKFVRELSFVQLVTAIYKAYPEMKVNSVFQGCV